MMLNFDFKLLSNDLKWLTLIYYVILENIFNFECFENFPNYGVSR